MKPKTRLREITHILMSHRVLTGITPEKLRLIIEDLGPAFVKLGQIMSMRYDILPAAYCKELEKLHADVKPMNFATVKATVEEAFDVPIDSIFSDFSADPLGSASLAQVHGAILIENGCHVAVKVQRPGVFDTMEQDIAFLKKIVRRFHISTLIGGVVDLGDVLDEMWTAAQQEMDFLLEASHTKEFAANCIGQDDITCPAVYLVKPKVLVLQHIGGIDINDNDGLAKAGYDLAQLGKRLAENYLKQILDDAFFHADPHPGNLRVANGKIVWLDFGMMGRMSPAQCALLRRGVRAIAENDVYEVKNVVLSMGTVNAPLDHNQLYTDFDDLMTRYVNMEMGNINLGAMLQDLILVAGKHKISMPKSITLFGRGLLTIEGVISRLSPEINMIEIMAGRMADSMIEDFDLEKTLKHSAKSLFRSGQKALDLPAQLSDLLHVALKGQGKVNFSASQESMRRTERMVNKIIICILCAALLIAGSLLCMAPLSAAINTSMLGIVFFALAFLCGCYLLFCIIRKK